jgi:dipeptidyl aminopeptidase/acylaminoacyl peptidase
VSQKTVAPYGTWSSPISAEMVAGAGVRLSAPWIEDGVTWWLEGRASESGRVVLVRLEPGAEPQDVVPEGFNVRTGVHEYGGGAYCVHEGVAYCSDFADQRLYRVVPGAAPVPITPDVADRRHRYADGRVTADGSLWLGVRERHAESDRAADVVNELVVVPTDGSADPRVVASGRDFYSSARVSPDGSRVCFLAWDLPWMPWDGCELFVADLAADGSLSGVEQVAGADGTESIWQPEWSPAGDLVFASDRSGWWNLERVRNGAREVVRADEAEFGYPAWIFGASSYAFLADGRIFCGFECAGFTRFAILDPDSGDLDEMDVGLDAWGAPYVATEGTVALVIAGSAVTPIALARVDVSTREVTTVRASMDAAVPAPYLSEPVPIEFPTENGLTAHALFYAPANPEFEGPVDEAPPLIVESHGGPTGSASPVFSLGVQFWTSRGFALVDVDYGGSTGYGRA